MKRKKNKFLTFLCSLIPGAGEMYMGFMKMGISLMVAFFGVICIASITNLDQLLFIALILWIYSFFHVHNIAGAPDSEFQALEDHYLIPFSDEEKISKYMKRVAAIIVTLTGVVILWNMVLEMLPGFVWDYIDFPLRGMLVKLIIAVGLIVLGIKMIQGEKKELQEMKRLQKEETNTDEVSDSENQQ